MAVFLVNTCKFNGCGITFPTLTELIRHIEDTHLDFDSRSIEQHELQQPSCLPISYILRVFTSDGSRKESNAIAGNHPPRKLMRSHSPVSSLCSTTPTGSEMDEEDNESDSAESSIDSWTNVNGDGDAANAILKIMSPNVSSNNCIGEDKDGKPFGCVIGGCKKRYRNANGLKYHAKSAHNSNSNSINSAQKKDPPMGPTKVYKCQCGKIYKTPHGLKNHVNVHHPQTQSQSQQTQSTGGVTKPPATTSTGTSTSSISKENILATFVRMKSLPCNTTTPLSSPSMVSVNRNSFDGLPIMLTLKTEKDKIVQINEKVANDLNGEKKCPIIAAPTLQQHLLSPIVAKSVNAKML